MRYELSDFEWAAIKPLLPNKSRGVRCVNDRLLNGIFWVLRSGAPWRDLPVCYGPRTTCYNRFVRWRKAGVWDRIMDSLAVAHDAAVQMIDTSIVRVHQHAACIARNRSQSMGRSRGGLTSKIHAVVDTNGQKANQSEEMLRQGLLRTKIAAVGPVVARAIEEAGGHVSIAPSNNFHMKPLVNEIIAAFN